MEALLDAIVTAIRAALPYLTWVGVLDDELLPPDGPQPPFVGIKDGGLTARSLPGKKDDETMSIFIIVYQSLVDQEHGASVLGRTDQLGDQGKGLLAIHADLKTLLNDNLLGQATINFAHRDSMEASRRMTNEAGRLIQLQRALYIYSQFV